jgi:hypothetical protein
MFELLVPATAEQSDRLEGDHDEYDKGLRPSLIVPAIQSAREATTLAQAGGNISTSVN